MWGECEEDQADGPGLPANRVWYLVLVQAYLEQGRAKGDRTWCHGVVLTKGWKAGTDNKWAVYQGVKELSVEDGVRQYDIGRHTVCCHYPREVVRIPEPTDGRVVAFLDGSGVGGQPCKAGAAAIQVQEVGQETKSIVNKEVYGTEGPNLVLLPLLWRPISVLAPILWGRRQKPYLPEGRGRQVC